MGGGHGVVVHVCGGSHVWGLVCVGICGGHCCHPLSFPGSWAFIVERVVIDMAHPDGHAMSAVWWWVSWSASASLASLSMVMLWVWDSPGVLYHGGGCGGGVG